MTQWREEFLDLIKKCKDCENYFGMTAFRLGSQVSPRCPACRVIEKRRYLEEYRKKVPRKKRLTSEAQKGNEFQCDTCCRWLLLGEKAAGKRYLCKKCKALYEAQRRLARGVKPRRKSELCDIGKRCALCEIAKPLGEYARNLNGRGGVSSYCKPCSKSRYYNKDKAWQFTKSYRLRHPERSKVLHRLHQFKRRAAKKASCDGTVTDELLKIIYSNPDCCYCHQSTPMNKRTLEHLIPLSRGGLHSATNLRMACRMCNSSKGAKLPSEFIRGQK